MKDENMTTSANPIGGVHICERCGKKLYWQDSLPKCWCESLTERVAALERKNIELIERVTRLEEAYEAPVHFDDDGKVTVCDTLPSLRVFVGDELQFEIGGNVTVTTQGGIGGVTHLDEAQETPLAVCQEAEAMMAKFKPTPEQEKKLQDAQEFFERKETEAAILAKAKPVIDWDKVAESRGFTIGWDNMPDCWKHSEIEASKAAVAEYLRQVKEGAE